MKLQTKNMEMVFDNLKRYFLVKMIETALKNTIINKKLGLSLKCFFKDSYKHSNGCYLIPVNHIYHFKQNFSEYIDKESSYGNQFLQFIELIIKFECDCVMRKKVFFGYFLFDDFSELKSKIKRWKITALAKEKLFGLGYKKRLSFLRWKTLTMKNHQY